MIDSHAHLTSDELYEELNAIMQRSQAAGVEAVINICTDKITLERGIEAKKRFSNLYNVGSTTPHDAHTLGDEEFVLFEKAAREGHLVGVGETGLDYFYKELDRDKQKRLMVRYFELALECDLPVVIHCRDAFDDLFEIADCDYKSDRLLLHCFTGEYKDAKRALDRGWRISFSGIVTFKKSEALREVVKEVPLDRLFVETDAPYLAPQSKRGKRCEPAFCVETAEVIAKVKETTLERVKKTTMDNTKVFFKI